jgi:hypothetical protein
MKKLLLIFFLGAFISTTAFAQTERSITVKGEASTEVEPDEITLRFSIKEEVSYDEEVETRTLDEMEEAIKKFLKEKKISESALSPAKAKSIMGIAMEKSNERNYKLKLNEAKMIKEVMTNLRILGANKIEVISLKSNKEAEEKAKIQKEALLNAKAKAANLLSVFDSKVGQVIEITEVMTPFGDASSGALGKMYDAIFSKLLSKSESDDYKVKIEYSVTVKFAIK